MLDFIFTHTPLKFFIQSFWRDEAFSVLLARRDIVHLLQLTARDFNPPLYYLLLKTWMGVFGQSEIATRSLSLIFFWATLFVFYKILTEVINIKPKNITPYLFLFLLNPFLLYYAFEARMYMMFTFVVTLSFYFLLTKRTRYYTLAVILGFYTHYAMAVVALVQIIGLKKKQWIIKPALYTILAYLPWLYLLLTQHSFGNEPFWALAQPITVFFNLPAIIYSGYEREFGYYEKYILAFSAVIMFVNSVSYFWSRKKKSTPPVNLRMFFLWAFLPCFLMFFASLITPVFVPRYIIFSSVGLLLLTASLLEKTPGGLKVMLLLILFVFTIHYNRAQIEGREKADLRSVITEIKGLAKEDDLLYVSTELDFHTAEYYFGEERVFIYGKTYQEIPHYVGKVLIPESKVVTALPHYPQKAFVLNEDSSYDIRAIF